MTSPVGRPNVSRPTGGAGYRPGATNRPGTGGITRPTPLPGGGNRPGIGGIGNSRPGGGNRPGLGGYQPGTGGNRPGIGGNRPGLGDYRPGTGGNRPGVGGNRPGLGDYRPGAGGNRPGLGDYRPGVGGNRPGIGGNRPGLGDYRPGAGGNRPGLGDYRPGVGGNRPGLGDYRPGGGVNRPGRPDLGDHLGIVNRPNQWNNRPGGGIGGGWFGNNTNININVNNGWGGGRRWAGSGWGWGRPISRFHGNWYRGSWGRNRFGGWFGPVGMGFGPRRWPIRVFPTWGHAGLVGWGLGPWANRWLYSGFSNPYFVAPVIHTTVVAGAAPVYVPDYSRPLDLSSLVPESEGTEWDDSTFLAARDAFEAGDYPRALSLTDLALQPNPNDPVLHEFRALCLFALGRYDEAAAILYTVLTAGPGWDWATMVGLYPDVDTYTRQLRALEGAIKGNTAIAAKRFVLAYHYMVQDHLDQARQQFEQVAKLQPKDALAIEFARLLAPPTGDSAVAATETARSTETDLTHQPPSPPPAALVGTWKATPTPEVSLDLTIREDGQFVWDVNANGQPDSISGEADYVDGVLTLIQADAPALAGKVVNLGEKQFGFELLGGPEGGTIQFSR